MINAAVIYELYKNECDKSYIGSSQDLNKRISRHKYCCNTPSSRAYNYPVYKFIRENGGFDKWNFRVIEKRNFNTIKDMKEREKFFIKSLNAGLNKNIPNRNPIQYYLDNKEKKQQYYIDNRDRILLNVKIYREKNFNKILKKREENREKYRQKANIKKKKIVECSNCGCKIQQGSLVRHKETIKCKKNTKHHNLLDYFKFN